MTDKAKQRDDVFNWFLLHVGNRPHWRKTTSGAMVGGAWRGATYACARGCMMAWDLTQGDAQSVVWGVFVDMMEMYPSVFVTSADLRLRGLVFPAWRTVEARDVDGERVVVEVLCDDWLAIRDMVPRVPEIYARDSVRRAIDELRSR